jgi:Putative polyhydroxyalkanoic acid system protein (PHA_gran_rgn)
MPKFNVTVPHALPQAEAAERLNRFADILREKFKDSVSDLDQSWEGNVLAFHFKTFGFPLSGKIAVGEKALVVDGDLPFTAMMFKGKIESSIREQLERLMTSGIGKKK